MSKQETKIQLLKHQSDCLAIIDQQQHLLPNQPIPWDLHGSLSFTRDGYQVLFLDQSVASLLTPYWHMRFDHLKLINPDRPAVRISFFFKHKYWLKRPKDLTAEAKRSEIVRYLQVLDRQSEKLLKIEAAPSLFGEVATTRLKSNLPLLKLQQEIDTWQSILQNLDQYDLSISNYYYQYRYWYLNFKYVSEWTDQTPQQYESDNAHLLSPQRDLNDPPTIIQPKLNVLFVDTQRITEDHDYQNKTVEDYLNNYPIRTNFRAAHREIAPSGQLFVRPKSDSIEG